MTIGEADKDLLLKFFDYEIRRMEFYDAQRASMTSLLFTVSSALVAVTSFREGNDTTESIIGIFLIALGFYGVAFSAKYYLRSREHRIRSKAIEKVLDRRFGGMTLLALREDAKSEARKIDGKWWFRMIDSGDKLNLFWAVLPALISVVGFMLLVLGK